MIAFFKHWKDEKRKENSEKIISGEKTMQNCCVGLSELPAGPSQGPEMSSSCLLLYGELHWWPGGNS